MGVPWPDELLSAYKNIGMHPSHVSYFASYASRHPLRAVFHRHFGAWYFRERVQVRLKHVVVHRCIHTCILSCLYVFYVHVYAIRIPTYAPARMQIPLFPHPIAPLLAQGLQRRRCVTCGGHQSSSFFPRFALASRISHSRCTLAGDAACIV